MIFGCWGQSLALWRQRQPQDVDRLLGASVHLVNSDPPNPEIGPRTVSPTRTLTRFFPEACDEPAIPNRPPGAVGWTPIRPRLR